jgi:hypothetical protein
MKTGYCSICKRDDLKKINKAIEAGLSYNSVREIVENPPAKATFFKHKEHVTHPLLTDADSARANPVIQPKNNKEVLEAIRDIGLKNAMENPDKITTNHALRAAAILADKEQKIDQVQIILAKLVQGNPEPQRIEMEVVEGSYTPVEELDGKRQH